MTLDWVSLDRRARSGDQPGVARLILEATEEERLAAAKTVEAGIKAVDMDELWRADVAPAPGFALAVVGTAPGASRAATLLLRRGTRGGWPSVQVGQLLRIAAGRELDWLGDLGVRLAMRLPTRDVWTGAEWDFVAAILRAGGALPPVTEGVVRGWLAGLIRPRGRKLPPLSMRLRDDPDLDVLLPGVFEIDGMGADIFNATAGAVLPESAIRFHQAVAALVAEDRLERKTILAATIDRLARGDKPNALRPFVLLHDELAPTVDEIAAHALDYTRLLTDGPGPVATVAQRSLRTLDDSGRLDLETLLEASVPALLRPEKTLVKAQISWLERVARREPGRAGDVFATVSAAFGHPTLEIQERALTLVGKHLPGLPPDTVARLAEAASVLTGDLPAHAAALFATVQPGTVPAPSAPAVPETAAGSPAGAALPPPAGPVLMPPPIATAAELAEEMATLVHEESGVRWERVLAALVTMHAAGEREALATALTPVLERDSAWFLEDSWNPGSTFVALGTAVRMATEPPRHDGNHQRLHLAVRTAWHEGRRGGGDSDLPAGPDGVLTLRAAEIAVHLNGSMMPMLIATPTHTNGSIDPAVLLDRLSRAEAEGWQPWPFDLEQALLRLPRTTPADVTARAAALTSPAGRQFAHWLGAGGLPDPVSEPFAQVAEKDAQGSCPWDRPVPRRMAATLRPSRVGGLRLERQLLTLDPAGEPEWMPDTFAGLEDVLTMVLPHHREVAAAWAIGDLAALADQDRRGAGKLLPLLADCHGPVGPAMAYAMAYTFAAKQESDRSAAVDAFLTLAAGAEPFARQVGAAFADLASDSTVKLGRAVPALADAHLAGASAPVWELLTAALPPLLTTRLRAVPDLLELATQVAVTIGARTVIPGLAEATARPGSSRATREAQRLQSTLTR